MKTHENQSIEKIEEKTCLACWVAIIFFFLDCILHTKPARSFIIKQRPSPQDWKERVQRQKKKKYFNKKTNI